MRSPLQPNHTSRSALLLAWVAVGSAIGWHDGSYGAVAVGLAALGTALAAVAVAGPRWAGLAIAVDPERVARASALVLVGTGLVWAVTRHPRYDAANSWFDLARTLAVGVAVLVVLCSLPTARSWLLGVVLVTLLLAGVSTVLSTPVSRIDVWFLLQDSTRGLLEGRDMYRQSWPGSPGLVAVYPYLPGTSVLLAPLRWLTGDVRYSLLATLPVTVLALRRLAGTRHQPPSWSSALRGRVLPLVAVLPPLWTFGLQQSWTEPLLLALLALTVVCASEGRTRSAVVALGLALACKQHIVVLLPLCALWPALGLRRTLAACGVGFAVVLPWLVAGPADLWHDAVSVNLGYPVLPRSLSLPALLLRHGITASFLLLLGGLALAYLAVVLRLPRTTYGFCAGSALVVLTLTLLNKQSFWNHWSLALGLLVMAAIAGDLPTTPADDAELRAATRAAPSGSPAAPR